MGTVSRITIAIMATPMRLRMKTPDWVAKVEAEPCRCKWCSSCQGRGTIRVYGGRLSIDDLAELEDCLSCDGFGLIELCDRCQVLEDYDRENENA